MYVIKELGILLEYSIRSNYSGKMYLPNFCTLSTGTSIPFIYRLDLKLTSDVPSSRLRELGSQVTKSMSPGRKSREESGDRLSLDDPGDP